MMTTHTTEPVVVVVDLQKVVLPKSKVTAEEILIAAERVPAAEFQIAQVLKNRQRALLRLNQEVDLSSMEVERFQTWKSDRTFRLFVDDVQFDWGSVSISAEDLKELAGVDPATVDVWQEVVGGDDHLIATGKSASLDGKDAERFFSARGATTEGRR